ncbi:hypothetical protein [Streptococcus sp. SR4]|uniref:hypothetical protein n=1 Tax=Streptococcus sp. SR4 TaxID=1161417 RepID=UPI0003E260AA|nr:hypothetical protein [Streptococcus sp. SR4]ETS93064.1 RelA/SpoT domain protein [Streptococcus sp. SR4]
MKKQESKHLENWLSVFNDVVSSGLVVEANDFLNEYIEKFLKENPDIRVAKQNRIKTNVSFKDKLIRNNYVSSWTYDDSNHQANKETLCKNLPDFIGFRINPLFGNEEESLANSLIEFLNNQTNIVIPEAEQNPKNLQSNGHAIIKFQGHINLEKEPTIKFGFEIQIKSMVHNLWGEVEHRSIYKPNSFDFRIDENKKSVENIWQILTSVDQQLFNINKEIYRKDDLLKQLFTIYLDEMKLIPTLNSHYYYSIFFNTFLLNDIESLEKLLAQLIIEKNIESKLDYNIENLENNFAYDTLETILAKILYTNESEFIEKIFQQCFNKTEETSFKNILISSIIKNMGLDESITEDSLLYDYDEDDDDNKDSLITEDKSELLTSLEQFGFKTGRYK